MDDGELLRVLRQALARQESTTQAEIVESGLAAWTWRTMDEELAALAYDSADHPSLAGLRGTATAPRQLTFEFGEVRLELEVGPRRMLGLVLPANVAQVELHTPDGEIQRFETDGQGRFVVEPALTGPVRLRCHLPGAEPWMTGWVLI
ncbi:MAG TPA: hypothetical protein VFC19_34020 [Candidatus Limnocylindrales bacterium]|nr:hypothetical protein [Candidatus Limnocylindrales bacterium]